MSKEFKVTVITPFHNTRMELFLRTYESLKKQTIGFENIEWVIVLHNCGEKNIADVKELLKDHDNVFLKELNNDAHSASSPRNYGL
ncbi:MAG: glycosyltransferase family A protein [Eubacteriales bacterium]|nr:glycosyltransferase family A protein [Eubacteriales bacterium]